MRLPERPSTATAPIEKAILLPDDIGFTEAAAILLQGLTAQYLVERGADAHWRMEDRSFLGKIVLTTDG